MITIKSQELKQFEYLKELLEENISDKTTDETSCYALWGNNTLELDTNKDIDEKKTQNKEKQDPAEPELEQEPQSDSTDEKEKSLLEPTPEDPVSPYPILRLTDGIFAGYSRKDPAYSIYYAFQSDVYYNFKKESNIESLLRSNWIPLEQDWNTANLALQMINKYGITKYSEYPPVPDSVILSASNQNILLVDQPVDDDSVLLGSANEQTFNDMLLYAFDNYQYANIYVKLHPDTIDGKKEGYLKNLLKKHGLNDHPSIHVIDYHCNITSFFHFVQEVFVVSSQVGFEALLRNKNVRCFGMPFYSGWGLTNDMQVLTDPRPQRSTIDIFVALVLQYTLYLNPFTNKKGTILDVLEYIALQQRHSNRKNVVFYNTEFSEFKNIDVLLNTDKKNDVLITKSKKLQKHVDDFILTDKKVTFKEVESLKYRAFLAESFLFPRSYDPQDVMSLIVDHNGPYYDPKSQSDLDYMLTHESYTEYEKSCANKFIEAVKLKYLIDAKNHLYGNVMIEKKESGKKTIFVPGQLENDEFTFAGGDVVIPSDYELLIAICQKVENCLIIYKPNEGSKIKKLTDLGRGGLISLNTFMQEKKNKIVIEHEASNSCCIDAADEIHLLNHNCGIEAIIKGKKVVTYGLPFYGGLGLTEDRQEYPRAKRNINLEEFALATCMLYPRYKIPNQKGFTSAFAAIEYDKSKHNKIQKSSGFFGFFGKIKSFF